MNRRTFIRRTGVSTAGLSMLSFTGFPAVYKNSLISVVPEDNGKALINPDMGWTMHYYSNIITNYGSRLEPSDTLDDFPGLSTVYLRVPWSFIETEEGKFNWELLDTPAQRWISKGKRVAFRVSAEESWMRYATPKWVKDAGAEGIDLNGNKDGTWEPKFDDPIFLEKVENFVKAMAERYDDKSYVDFVDVGHFGMWGEGHTVMSGIEYPFEVKKWHIDVYLKYFKNTLLCISDDFAGHDKPGDHFPISDYAFSKGVTLRDDSIMVQPAPRNWYHSEMAQQFWPTLPVILEHEHYGNAIKRGSWDKDLFLKSVEDYHASYMSIHWWPRILLNENKDVIDKINLRMGYRLQLVEASWPEEVKAGEAFEFKTEWKNAGVAPCYKGGFLCLTIKDGKEGIVAVLVNDEFDFNELETGEPGKSKSKTIASMFTIAPVFKDANREFSRTIQTGDFQVFVSIGSRDGTPIYELPYENNDGNKRYKIGNITLNK
ncbi:DUF4832 domain-containing protein [Maribellus sediminis]|uniref:DUF4832 domain-containing protein n=1 Tax=Maribellus sediminis TaxID=2696285 RepID=UPI00142F5E77|nr:DUF4832 domain-containing protein [Maribellus sediminis]